MSAIKDGLRFKTAFTTTAWVLIPVAIGINLIGRFFTQTLNLPLFLDTIGTTMAAFLAGPWVAAVAGVLTNLVIGLTLEATSIPFGIVNAAIGIVAGVMAAHGFLRSTGKIILTMLCLTAITIITAMPHSGSRLRRRLRVGRRRGYGILRGFRARYMVESVIGQQLVTSPLDKVLTVLLAFALIKGVPQRYRPPFGREVIPF